MQNIINVPELFIRKELGGSGSDNNNSGTGTGSSSGSDSGSDNNKGEAFTFSWELRREMDKLQDKVLGIINRKDNIKKRTEQYQDPFMILKQS